jgi:Zn-dependent alcohol dehydrogenase
VSACGVCRTDLHVVDGELPNPHIPIIPGHEIVGRIDVIGAGVEDLHIGERIGIPWLGHTCGACPYCMMHRSIRRTNWPRKNRPVRSDPQNRIDHGSRAIDANVLSQSMATGGRTK